MAPVLFVLGGEGPVTTPLGLELYRIYGEELGLHVIIAEHRGYGVSQLTKMSEDLKYISTDQAVFDYYELVKKLKQKFTGTWLGYGTSYAGGLVIKMAHHFPKIFFGIISSSGLVESPFVSDKYDESLNNWHAVEDYNSFEKHLASIKDIESFNKSWIDREFLELVIMALSQYQDLNRYLPIVRNAAQRNTQDFLGVLKQFDQNLTQGTAISWASSRALVDPTYGSTKNLSGRTWFYQQCTEMGAFFTSSRPMSIFKRSQKDYISECQSMFGETPDLSKPWDLKHIVTQLKLPHVFIAGERDPWFNYGVTDSLDLPNGEFILVGKGFHTPERSNLVVATKALRYILDKKQPK